MTRRYAEETLWVRACRGELRQLFTYREKRGNATSPGMTEWLRWARDEAGRWYSFSDFGDAVVESLSGDWFSIVTGTGKPPKR